MPAKLPALPAAIWRSVCDFVYPPFCPRCGEPPGDDGARPTVCGDCRELLVDTSTPCDRCGAPLGPNLDALNGCIHCRKDRFAFRSVRALGRYAGGLETACRVGKEPAGRILVAALANLLPHVHGRWFEDAAPDVVVPVPRYWTRRWSADDDAAETVATVLARRLRIRFARRILVKVRRTPPQATLSPTERRRNLRGAFRTRRRLAGRKVLLVDDVLTTGTTAHECARALLDAGAARIDVAVLARGVGK